MTKSKASKKYEPAALSALAGRVSDNGGANLAEFVEQLKQQNDLKLFEEPKNSGNFTAQMMGIDARGVGERVAIANWANSARRALMRAAG